MFAEVFEGHLAIYEALRRIGFLPNEVFVAWNGGAPVTLIRADGKEFVVRTHAPGVPKDEAEYVSEWLKASAWWNDTATNSERMLVYHKYITEEVLLSLILALYDADMPLRSEGARMVSVGMPQGEN